MSVEEKKYKHRPTLVKAFLMDQKSHDYILAHYMDKLENWKNPPNLSLIHI